MPSPLAKGSEIKGRAGQKLRDMDHNDLGKSGFWISQIFVVVATIIGVYLAAHAGLEQAIAFDRLTSQESSYYLRKSLHEELEDNVSILRAYTDEVLARRLWPEELVKNRPVLSRFVWETMRYSPQTLEVPSIYLTGARQFYSKADTIIRKVEGGVYGATYAAEQMNEVLDQVEGRLIPGLRQNYEQLAIELADKGIEVTTLRETE